MEDSANVAIFDLIIAIEQQVVAANIPLKYASLVQVLQTIDSLA
jgi:hypothetical protein